LNRTGIVVAMVAEAKALTGRSVAADGSIHLLKGNLIQLSGIGAIRASLSAKALVGKGIDALLSWGVAGGLVSKLVPGSLILPETIIAANRTVYPVDPSWHEHLCQRIREYVELHTEPLAESTMVLSCSGEKRSLSSQTGAIAADMESAAVAAVAQEAGVPFLAVRAVADPVGLAIPQIALAAVDIYGRLSLLKLIRGLVRHPEEMAALFLLSRNFRAAKNTLAKVAPWVRDDLPVS
jgi:adenosylhomocysteine nucleosidase